MNEARIKELLKNTGREGIDDLISYMEENDFFTSPCSTRYHLAEEGGLATHSLNVYENILRINEKIRRQFIAGISGYADRSKDGRECLAEAFVRYRNGEWIPDEARKLIRKYILHWRRV